MKDRGAAIAELDSAIHTLKGAVRDSREWRAFERFVVWLSGELQPGFRQK